MVRGTGTAGLETLLGRSCQAPIRFWKTNQTVNEQKHIRKHARQKNGDQAGQFMLSLLFLHETHIPHKNDNINRKKYY